MQADLLDELMAYPIVSERFAVQAAFFHEDKFLQEKQDLAQLAESFSVTIRLLVEFTKVIFPVMLQSTTCESLGREYLPDVLPISSTWEYQRRIQF